MHAALGRAINQKNDAIDFKIGAYMGLSLPSLGLTWCRLGLTLGWPCRGSSWVAGFLGMLSITESMLFYSLAHRAESNGVLLHTLDAQG